MDDFAAKNGGSLRTFGIASAEQTRDTQLRGKIFLQILSLSANEEGSVPLENIYLEFLFGNKKCTYPANTKQQTLSLENENKTLKFPKHTMLPNGNMTWELTPETISSVTLIKIMQRRSKILNMVSQKPITIVRHRLDWREIGKSNSWIYTKEG